MFQVRKRGTFGSRGNQTCKNKRTEEAVIIKLSLCHALAVLEKGIDFQNMINRRKGSVSKVAPITLYDRELGSACLFIYTFSEIHYKASDQSNQYYSIIKTYKTQHKKVIKSNKKIIPNRINSGFFKGCFIALMQNKGYYCLYSCPHSPTAYLRFFLSITPYWDFA